MNTDTYYRDHWLEIDPQRMEDFEEMFRWRPRMEPLLEPAGLTAGLRVVDFGCGPGMLTLELARRVGPGGHVHAVDLNPDFLERTRQNAAREGLAEQVSIHRASDDRLPLEDGSVDRVICKNVLEYVDDAVLTLRDFRRALAPGGRVHAIDSDWGMLAVEPLGPERIAELFAAASMAYRTPLIGRKLYGLMRAAGFEKVRVEVVAGADTRGTLAPILFNMARYARVSGKLEASAIEGLLDDLKRALAEGTYLLVLPQFVVTGYGGASG
jgi:ubiquinone/menaquinone biosynthesis C-methylase UbiE